jgi:hypothetical protein
MIKPKSKTAIVEEGCVFYSNYINLSNKDVLFVSRNQDSIDTYFKKFSVNNLKNCIVKKTLRGEYNYLGTMPDGSLLFNQHNKWTEDFLIRLCSRNLNIISKNQWKRADSIGIINNNSFFVIERDETNIIGYTIEYLLKIYQWDEEKLLSEKKSIKLMTHPDNPDLNMNRIQSLGKNRYCCYIHGRYSDESEILIFEVDPSEDRVIEHGIISPGIQEDDIYLYESGNILVLPNGNLLTYHKNHGLVQIWDAIKFNCIQAWDWSEVKEKNFLYFNLKILCFSDLIHLLIIQETSVYIFNMENFSLKQIPLKDVNIFGNHYILNNGKLVIFTGKTLGSSVDISFVNLKEIMLPIKRKCEIYERSYFYSHHLFQHMAGLPKEISDDIVSYAFTPETKMAFMARKDIEIIETGEEKNNKNNKNSKKCFVM